MGHDLCISVSHDRKQQESGKEEDLQAHRSLDNNLGANLRVSMTAPGQHLSDFGIYFH